MPIQLLALDADGTVLDSAGRVRPAVREAVSAAQERGVMTVLCTGRRYRTALPICRELGLSGPQVVQNGVLVKHAESAETLASWYLSAPLYLEALALMRSVASPLIYVDAFEDNVDIVCEPAGRGQTLQAEYLDDNVAVTRVIPSIDEPPPEPVVMLSVMADEATLRSLRARVEAAVGNRVRTNLLMNKNYHGYLLEVVSSESGKWTALERVASERGISPNEILAIGDDENDAEMIDRAGIGVAMANAVEAVRNVADYMTASNDEDGVAQAIERFVLAAALPRT